MTDDLTLEQPTLDDLYRAVIKAALPLNRSAEGTTPAEYEQRAAQIHALIEAAEARGAARERARECRWTQTESEEDHPRPWRNCEGHRNGGVPTRCPRCGGRVVVRERADQ